MITAITDFSKYYGKISNSGQDENGRYSSGRAGDQTGREWCIINWYSRPWNVVLRYPDRKVGNMIATLGIYAAQNDLIGYDQYERTTYWTHLQASNYDPRQITVPCEDDCSAGVAANVKATGYILNLSKLQSVSVNNWTGSLKQSLSSAGFMVLSDRKYLTGYDYLLPGDILLNEQAHVATNLGVGRYSGSAVSSTPSGLGTTKKLNKTQKFVGVVTADSLNVRSGVGINYPNLAQYPRLNNGNLVDVCDSVKASDGSDWYYIKIAGKYYGFVSAKYIRENSSVKSTTSTVKESTKSNTGSISKNRKFVGEVTADSLNVRTWAGTDNPIMKAYPRLARGNKVDVCDTVKDSKKEDWYYIKIAGKYYGFVSAKYIKKV